MKINWKFWQRNKTIVIHEPDDNTATPPGLTITDGRYGRLAHLLEYDPDDYGWRGKSPEEMLRILNTPVPPAQRYGFDGLTLDDVNHAASGAYKAPSQE